jgi:hypothetical protein
MSISNLFKENGFDLYAKSLNLKNNLNVGGNVVLPTSEGSASNLNYYEEGTHSTNWTGIWASPIAGNIKYVRIGKVVTLTFPEVLGTSVEGATFVTAVTVLPSRLRPTTSATAYFIPCILVQDGSSFAGKFAISSSTGGMAFTNTTEGDWSLGTTGTTEGFRPFSISYVCN